LLDTFYEAGHEVPQGALAKRNTPDVDILRQHTPTPFYHSTALSGRIQRLHILRLVALNEQQTNPDNFRRDRHQQSTLANLHFNTWPNAQDELSQFWTPLILEEATSEKVEAYVSRLPEGELTISH
jgi:hypothetical protein